jgi:osmoprotectant transport system ATP-binding protein
MIELDQVEQTFDGEGGLRRTSLTVADGERLALVGASGSGKSTLLRLVVGLVVPARGEVRVDGVPMRADTATALRRRMGYAIQDGGLFPHLTARDNVLLVARHVGWPEDRCSARLAELGELVRLPASALARHPAELSGGQRQRVGLARALALDPAILLFDEPLGALDPVVRAELQDDLLAILERARKTVLLVTHDLAEAAYLAPTLAVLRDGAIVQRGTLRELRAAPSDRAVTQLLTAARGLPEEAM